MSIGNRLCCNFPCEILNHDLTVVVFQFPYNNTGEVTLTKLRPYCAYNFKVAMMYLEDEFSKFIFPHDIETPQDSKLLLLLLL